MNRRKKRQAFTLIELIIVIAILGILAAVAIPRYNNSKAKAAHTAHLANVQMLRSAAEMRIMDNDSDFTWTGTNDTPAKDSEKYVEKWPVIPNGLKFDPDYSNYTVICTHKKITITPDENAKIKN